MRIPAVILLAVVCSSASFAQMTNNGVKEALAQGDLYQSKKKYDLALDAYHNADKLAKHQCGRCYLKIGLVEKQQGDFSSALDETKKALKVAGDDKTVAVDAYLMRANLLVQLTSKPTDKKLKEAEESTRQAIALEPTYALARFNLGVILLKQARDEEGKTELAQAIEMKSLNSTSITEAKKLIANPILAREPFAPKFQFTTKEKQVVSNSSLRGKVALLDFWGTWCPPCKESVPVIQSVNKKFSGKGFELVGISSDDDEDVWRTFVESKKMDWAEYIDLEGTVISAFQVDAYPTYIVLDKDGVIRYRQSGFGSETQGQLEEAIGKALKRNSDPSLAKAAAADSDEETAKPEPAMAPRTTPTAANTTSAEGMKNGVEGASQVGGVFTNAALGITYKYPANWTMAKPESLEELNAKTEAEGLAALRKQRPDLPANVKVNAAKYVFYASKRGSGDPTHMSVPCIRMIAAESRSDLTLASFSRQTEIVASSSNAEIVTPVTAYKIRDHEFFRVDLQKSIGGMKIYQTFAQTIAGDDLLTIEMYGSTKEELQEAAATLPGLVIED